MSDSTTRTLFSKNGVAVRERQLLMRGIEELSFMGQNPAYPGERGTYHPGFGAAPPWARGSSSFDHRTRSLVTVTFSTQQTAPVEPDADVAETPELPVVEFLHNSNSLYCDAISSVYKIAAIELVHFATRSIGQLHPSDLAGILNVASEWFSSQGTGQPTFDSLNPYPRHPQIYQTSMPHANRSLNPSDVTLELLGANNIRTPEELAAFTKIQEAMAHLEKSSYGQRRKDIVISELHGLLMDRGMFAGSPFQVALEEYMEAEVETSNAHLADVVGVKAGE